MAPGLLVSGLVLPGCLLDLGPPLVESSDSGLTISDGLETDNVPTDPTGTDIGTPTDPIDVTDPVMTDPPTATDDGDAMVDPVTDGETDPGCGVGQEECDGGCAPIGECGPPEPTCDEVCHAPNAMTRCENDQCTFLGCERGFEDCDGSLDLIIDVGDSGQNGCETRFDSGLGSDGPFLVPHRTIVSESNWEDIPVFALQVPCSQQDCGMDHPGLPPQTPLFEGLAPSVPGDLRVGFSMAWDATGLWIRTVLIDDHLVTGRGPNGEGEPDPRFNDHVEFVFDGLNPDTYGDPQDHHLFTDFGELAFDQRTSGDLREQIRVDVVELGICQIMTSKLSENYISTSSSATSLMVAGNTFRFAIGVNDFDPSENDPQQIQRQHRVFYQSPGRDYVFGPTRSLPQMTLLE